MINQRVLSEFTTGPNAGFTYCIAVELLHHMRINEMLAFLQLESTYCKFKLFCTTWLLKKISETVLKSRIV